jgi:hypothetical protein
MREDWMDRAREADVGEVGIRVLDRELRLQDYKVKKQGRRM